MNAEDATTANSTRRQALPVWVRSLVTIACWAIALVLVLRFFAAASMLFLGLLAAAAVASLLRPLADRMPGPRALCAVIVGMGFIVVVAGVVGLIGWLVGHQVAEQVRQWPQIHEQLNQTLARWSERLSLDEPMTVKGIVGQVGKFLGGADQQVLGWTANMVLGLLIAVIFIFLGSIYMLAEMPGRLMGPIGRLLPENRRPALQCVVNDLDLGLRWWLIGVLVSMAIVGIASWIGYTIVGLKIAIPLAMFAALAEIVPTIGSIFALIVALLFASVQGGGQVIGVIVVYTVIQTLEGNVIQPLVMERVVKMPPIVTLFTMILWSKIFGAPGLLLAIPVNMVIWSFAKHFIADPEELARCEPGKKVKDDEKRVEEGEKAQHAEG